jgi:hypothetical protein
MHSMPNPRIRKASPGPHDGPLDKLLPVLSVFTMLMTLPQVYTVWFEGNAAGVSLLSWSAYLLAACLWFLHGLQRHDKTIWVACIGWVIVDAAVVAGVLWHA